METTASAGSGYASGGGSVSEDGRFVAFYSGSPDLVLGDTNGEVDVFVRDVQRGVTRRVSLSAAGQQPNSGASDPVISGDGRYVLFGSWASNLVTPDTNNRLDIFVRDLVTNTLRRVSDGPAGVEGNDSAESFNAAITPDGRYVAFTSYASNLVPGDTNGRPDVFVRDLWTGVLRRATIAQNGGPSDGYAGRPTISADGRYVAFNSTAADLVAGDVNGATDVFVRDLVRGTTRLVSAGAAGVFGNGTSSDPSISRDGLFIAFQSTASNLVSGDTNSKSDGFVRDTRTGTVRRVTVARNGGQADGDSISPAISAGGRYIAFASWAANLVTGDTNRWPDAFVRDLELGTTRLVSIGYHGAPANNFSFISDTAVTRDGRFIAFESAACNLTAVPDTNQATDVFLRDLGTSTTQRVSQPL